MDTLQTETVHSFKNPDHHLEEEEETDPLRTKVLADWVCEQKHVLSFPYSAARSLLLVTLILRSLLINDVHDYGDMFQY